MTTGIAVNEGYSQHIIDWETYYFPEIIYLPVFKLSPQEVWYRELSRRHFAKLHRRDTFKAWPVVVILGIVATFPFWIGFVWKHL